MEALFFILCKVEVTKRDKDGRTFPSRKSGEQKKITIYSVNKPEESRLEQVLDEC